MTGVEDLFIGRQTQKSNCMYFVIRWLRSIVGTATAVEATNILLVLTCRVIWVPAQFFFLCLLWRRTFGDKRHRFLSSKLTSVDYMEDC